MPQAIIRRLFDSLSDLEGSVQLAKKAFSSSPSEQSEELLDRIEYYEEVIEKQKKLAQALCDHIQAANWAEVTRHIKLINGFSALINDDARGLIQQIMTGAAADADSVTSQQ